MGAAVADCCTNSPDQQRPAYTNMEANNNNNTTTAGYNNKKKDNNNTSKIEISPIIIINYIISLNNDQLERIWDTVDKNQKNKIDIDHDFVKLLMVIIDEYISTKLNGYDSTTNHRYAVQTRIVSNELNEDFEAILNVHGIYEDQYITKPFYSQNFKKYIIQMKNENHYQ